MSFLLIVTAVLIFLVAILVIREFWCYTQFEYQVHKKFPAPKTNLFVGTLWDIVLTNPEQAFRILRYWGKRFKPTFSLWWNGHLSINILNGKGAEQILTNTKCINKSVLYEFLQPFVGTGLLTSDGHKWMQRRKILTPAFHFSILQQQFHSIFKRETDLLINTIRSDDTKIIHLQDCMSNFTLNTVCETAMGVQLTTAEESTKYRRQIHLIGELILFRILRPWLSWNIIYKLTGNAKKFNETIVPVHNFTREIIKQRREIFQSNKTRTQFDNMENIYETKKIRYAMLDTLLDAEARGEQIDNEGIREEVDTFMFEGHDTTALTFTLFLLAENPDIQEKLYEEIREFADVKNIDEATMNDLNQLNYLDRVVKESLRIFPPVAFISRYPTEKVQFNDLMLPADTVINIHIFDLHRDESQFPDPERFDPDRFLPGEIAKRHPFAYIPFSAGQRNCIGQKFVLLEIKTLLVKLILNFQLEQVTKRDELIFIVDLVLRTKNPILVKFNLRK